MEGGRSVGVGCLGSNRRLGREDYTGFAGPAVADTDELCDVVPRL